jgi:hypothetical protein
MSTASVYDEQWALGCPEGATASFPCPKDVTGNTASDRVFLAVWSEGTGEGLVVVQERARTTKEAFRSEERIVNWETGEIIESAAPEEPNEEEKERNNRQRAERRAKKLFRHYVVRNWLVRMWTMTYEIAEWDRGKVVADMNGFLQRLRVELGELFPAAYVLELHPGGHGWHAHLALERRFIHKHRLQILWSHGIVQFSDGNKGVRKEQGGRAKARVVARYMSKYLTKEFQGEHPMGEHRYEVTQGFQVVRRSWRFRSLEAASKWLEELEGGIVAATNWTSDAIEDWHGPPVWGFCWN